MDSMDRHGLAYSRGTRAVILVFGRKFPLAPGSKCRPLPSNVVVSAAIVALMRLNCYEFYIGDTGDMCALDGGLKWCARGVNGGRNGIARRRLLDDRDGIAQVVCSAGFYSIDVEASSHRDRAFSTEVLAHEIGGEFA